MTDEVKDLRATIAEMSATIEALTKKFEDACDALADMKNKLEASDRRQIEDGHELSRTIAGGRLGR